MVNRKKERATGRNLSKGYLEGGDSDEDGVSLAQIKNKYKKGSGSKASGKIIICMTLSRQEKYFQNLSGNQLSRCFLF